MCLSEPREAESSMRSSTKKAHNRVKVMEKYHPTVLYLSQNQSEFSFLSAFCICDIDSVVTIHDQGSTKNQKNKNY